MKRPLSEHLMHSPAQAWITVLLVLVSLGLLIYFIGKILLGILCLIIVVACLFTIIRTLQKPS